jgi:hypothetical protein
MDRHRYSLRHWKRGIPLTGLLLALLLAVLPAAAQSVQGVILGSVKDASGAVVPGAQVTLTNIDEGTVRTTTSNSAGDYQFLDVKASHYSVQVVETGFEKWATSGVELAARQQLRINVSLAVGSDQQTVNVSSDNASAIETESPKISAVYTSDDMLDLPTNFRASSSGTSVVSAIGSMPGVQTQQGSFSLQGALPYQTEVTVDGISIQNIASSGSPLTATPSADDVAEMRVDGIMNNAEFGDPAQVTITSKGGTNKYHGAAWWYHQDSSLNAINFGAATKPHIVGNTFGAKASGPVVIPHLYDGHNKSFFFGDYEGYRFPQFAAEQYTVPTAAMKQGDFTNYTNPTVGFNGLTNPYTGTSWGNAIPNTALSSIAKQFLQFYPDPNHTATANGIAVPTTSFVSGQTANYYVNQDESTKQDQVDLRGDQYFGSNQKVLLWGRYTYINSPSNDPEPLAFPGSTTQQHQQQIVTSLNWTIKPNLINEFRYGFTQQVANQQNSFNGQAFTEGLGLQGLQDLSFFDGVPYVGGFTTISGFGPGRLSAPSTLDTTILTDNLTWARGGHNIKFGFDFRFLKDVGATGFSTGEQYGNFNFSNQGNGIGDFTGVDFADFLVGIPNNTFYDIVNQNIDGIAKQFHAYAQDEWKATPRLTLTYGVRWEYHPPFYDKGGYIGNFDPSVPLSGRVIYPDGASAILSQPFLASANACDADGVNTTNGSIVNGAPCMPVVTNSQAGLPLGLRKAPQHLLPRLGFAYRLTDDNKWVLRGGYGMYNVAILGSTFHAMTATIQGDSLQYVNSTNPTTHQPTYQWPQIYGGQGNSGCTTCYGQGEFDEANIINWKDPYTHQFTLSVDHDFGAGWGLRASYIGSLTRHLEWEPDQNTLPFSNTVSAYDQPASARRFPNWGRIFSFDPGANESYESMQLEATHRFQHGLHIDSIFTWAKALADNQGPDASGFAGERGGGVATSILDREADFGNVAGTRRRLWNTTAVYDLPVGRGKTFGSNMPWFLDAIVGGWRLSNIFTWQSGDYLTPVFSSGQGDPAGTGSGLTSTAAGWDPGHISQHPDSVPGVSWRPSHQNRNNWVNPAAFTCPGWPEWKPGEPCGTGAGYVVVNGVVTNTPRSPYGPPLPIGRFGNTQMGSIEGPGLINLNTGLAKTFALGQRFRLRAEGSFTNVLNHTNLNEGSMNLNLSSASFGTITSGIAARNGQVSMRLEF